LGVGREAENCKKKFVENLLRKKKFLEEAKAHLYGYGADDDVQIIILTHFFAVFKRIT
jgi:hypothetical protein